MGNSALDPPMYSGAENGPWPLIGEEILLMDEVDVFFTKDFGGSTLDQVKRIPVPAVHTALNKIVQIWDDNLEDGTMINRAYNEVGCRAKASRIRGSW